MFIYYFTSNFVRQQMLIFANYVHKTNTTIRIEHFGGKGAGVRRLISS